MGTAPLFPMFLKLAGRQCVVVGAGCAGEPKIRSLVDCGARVSVVAPAGTTAVRELAAQGVIVWKQELFKPSDLDGMFLVVAATCYKEANRAIYQEAQRRAILCNVVDDPAYCDFFYPAVVRRGRFQIAISTGGLSPALAKRVRKQLEIEFPPIYGEWLEQLGQRRTALFERVADPDLRRSLIHESATPEAFENFAESRQPEGAGTSLASRDEDVRLSPTRTGKESL